MNYVYALLVVLVLSLIFVLSYYLNSKVKIECDKDDMCDGCKIESCFHKRKREE